MKYPVNTNLTADALTSASAAIDAATFRRPDYTSLWQTLSDMAKAAIEGGDADEGAVLWLLGGRARCVWTRMTGQSPLFR